MKNLTIDPSVSDICKLTPLQEGLLYHYLNDKDTNQYILQWILDIEGLNDRQIVQDAINLLAKRYDALRTVILHDKLLQPQQVVLKKRNIEFRQVDLSGDGADERDGKIKEIAKKEVQRGFDLQRDSLVRIVFVPLGNGNSKIIWTMHHIIADGWSISLLTENYVRYCRMLQNGGEAREIEKLIEAERQDESSFSEYVLWLEKQDKEKALSYWRNLLEGYDIVADIEPLCSAGDDTDETVRALNIRLSQQVTKKLQKLAIDSKITMNTIVETVWGIVLQWYNHTDDVMFGKVVTVRNLSISGIEKMVGPFINTIPCRVKSKKGMRVIELLKEMQRQGIEGMDYSYLSLADIQRETEQGRDLVKTLFTFENYYASDDNLTGVKIEDYREETNYGVDVSAFMEKKRLCVRVRYDPRKYPAADMNLLIKRISHVLEQISENININIDELVMVTEEERARILVDFNDTESEYQREKTFVELFEEQAERTPEKAALMYGEEIVTYRELNTRANQLARRLREYGVKPNDFVAVISKRSIEMIVGIYGAIKAGGAYVPIDPGYPAERIRYILSDCRPKAVLVNQAAAETENPVIDLADRQVYVGAPENPQRVNKPDDLVYCIYTSGTTGKPKGVLNKHMGLVNRITWMNRTYAIGDDDVLMQKTTYTFDVSVWEILCWSIVGAKLCLLENGGEKEPYKICAAIEKYGVTRLHFVPSMFAMFLDYIENAPKGTVKLSSLRSIFSSGEALKRVYLDKYYGLQRKLDLKAELVNWYGPTEASIDVTYYNCRAGIKVIPIGRPISNTQIYILNDNRLCGIGIPGELCIAGDGLARGYLNKPELTAEKFVQNPFGKGRMYRTGDLARWLTDGNIEYLGRMDEQVKIRGFRIELGEIEYRLREIDAVNDAAVIAREDGSGSKEIYAYVVSDAPIDMDKIREQLGKTLPDYMIPAYLMQIEKLPVTSNGKLDKKALPEIEVKSGYKYVAPRNETEEILCRAFEETLGVKKAGVKDSFFKLGGHSLKAIKLENKLREFYEKIRVKDIYRYPTAERLAQYIASGYLDDASNDMPNFISVKEDKSSYDKSDEDVLINVLPFNDIFYKTCHYNSWFALFKHYGLNIYKYMVSDVIYYDYRKETGLLTSEYLENKPMLSLLEEDNVKYRAQKYCEDIIGEIISAVDQARPVIIYYDPYFNPVRQDAYGKKHFDHSIVVNGYNKKKETIYALEQEQWDTLSYGQIAVSFNDISNAYYQATGEYDNPFTYFEIIENASLPADTELLRNKYLQCMLENKALLFDSLRSLNDFIIDFGKTVMNQDELNRKTDDYISSINFIIHSKQVEKYRIKYLFGNEKSLLDSLDRILEIWNQIRIYLGRYLYSGIYKKSSFSKSILFLDKLYAEENEYVNTITKMDQKSFKTARAVP